MIDIVDLTFTFKRLKKRDAIDKNEIFMYSYIFIV